MQTLISGESSARVSCNTDFLLMGLGLMSRHTAIVQRLLREPPSALVSTIIPRAQDHSASLLSNLFSLSHWQNGLVPALIVI